MMLSQAKNCSKKFEVGSLLQILGKITTLHANLNILELEHGGFMVKLSHSGNTLAQVHSCGYMGSVSICAAIISPQLMIFAFSAGAGKSILWYVNLFHVFHPETHKVPSPSSSIIQDIRSMCESGLASLAFFYCDFREDQKRHRRGLLSSLLVQLCEQSDAYYDALSKFYSAHKHGSQHASDSELAQRLTDLLAVPGQATVYIVIDALDECPITTGLSSHREEVLGFVEELVGLQVSDMRICVTSRPEADIELVFGPLVFRSVSLHGENGQVHDIAEYVKFVVSTDRNMNKWRKEDKELVIQVLTEKAGGM